MGLVENTAKRADRHLRLLRHNHRIDDIAGAPDGLDVPAPAAPLHESRSNEAGLISPKQSGLSRANFDLDCADHRRPRGLRWLEMEFEGFLEIGQSLFLGPALAGHIDLKAQGNVPVRFPPNSRRERTCHDSILL